MPRLDRRFHDALARIAEQRGPGIRHQGYAPSCIENLEYLGDPRGLVVGVEGDGTGLDLVAVEKNPGAAGVLRAYKIGFPENPK